MAEERTVLDKTHFSVAFLVLHRRMAHLSLRAQSRLIDGEEKNHGVEVVAGGQAAVVGCQRAF